MDVVTVGSAKWLPAEMRGTPAPAACLTAEQTTLATTSQGLCPVEVQRKRLRVNTKFRDLSVDDEYHVRYWTDALHAGQTWELL